MSERFHDSVTSQCDEAMLFSGLDWPLDWRNDYYVDDLNRILEISRTSGRGYNYELAVKHWADTSVLAVIRREQPILDSPTSLFSTSSGGHTLDPSPTSEMSWTFTGSSLAAEVQSYTTSPTSGSQASISPTPPGFTTPLSSVVSCKSCSKDFKGSPQDAMSNLQRHLRTSLRHNKQGNLKCPLPECETKGPMRSDNMGPHLQNFHNMSSKSARQSIIDQCKCKSSAKRGDSTSKSRRRPCKKE